MKFVVSLLPMLAWLFSTGYTLNHPVVVDTPQANASFYNLTVEDIDGGTIRMADYKGKYVLCVNVASQCGYTPQYKDLQALYERYQDNLVIIGFPCNQFLGQEPGDNTEIKGFCEKNYGVTFPLTAKIDVKGKHQHPIYQWLTSQEVDGRSEHEVKWNFHKFLVNPEGKLIAVYPSKVSTRSTPDRGDVPYELNITYSSALSEPGDPDPLTGIVPF